MALRDLIPWNNGSRDVSSYHNQGNPLLAMHREMNRLFDEAFRAFDIGTFGSQAMSWPSVEVNETDKEVKVVAELPGLEEKDVAVELANGVLTISGEKKSETEDKERRFSERFYGRFERRDRTQLRAPARPSSASWANRDRKKSARRADRRIR